MHEIHNVSLKLWVNSGGSWGGGGEQNFIPGTAIVSSHQTAAQANPVCQNLYSKLVKWTRSRVLHAKASVIEQ